MALWAKLLLGAAAVFILLPTEVALLRSIGSDVAMLTDAFGLVGGLLIFASPTLAILVWSRSATRNARARSGRAP